MTPALAGDELNAAAVMAAAARPKSAALLFSTAGRAS